MDYSKLTKKELYQIAKEKGFNSEVYSASRKTLIKFIEKSDFEEELLKEDFATRENIKSLRGIKSTLKLIESALAAIAIILILILIF